MTGIAFVGCGFVADFYLEGLRTERNLKLVGVMDVDSERARQFGQFYGVHVFDTLDELLTDPGISIVVNLTNPSSHYEVSRAALLKGKHVYSEKPLTQTLEEACELARLARERNLELACAPCTVFGESAQTIQNLLLNKSIGRVRLVYAELDDGPVHLAKPETWRSRSGAPWPSKDEFTVGCTLEHAAYYVSWMVAFFGPATEVHSYSAVLVPDKGVEVEKLTPDFSVGCIVFASGIVARLTCSIYAPHNHAMSIVGDEGVISIDEGWHHSDPVRLRRYSALGMRSERYSFIRKSRILRRIFGLRERRVPYIKEPEHRYRFKSHHIDRCRGIGEMADAISVGRTPRLGGDFCIHVNEIVLALQKSSPGGTTTKVVSSCDPLEPMWP
jgi:predicted dehydrogenase